MEIIIMLDHYNYLLAWQWMWYWGVLSTVHRSDWAKTMKIQPDPDPHGFHHAWRWSFPIRGHDSWWMVVGGWRCVGCINWQPTPHLSFSCPTKLNVFTCFLREKICLLRTLLYTAIAIQLSAALRWRCPGRCKNSKICLLRTLLYIYCHGNTSQCSTEMALSWTVQK